MDKGGCPKRHSYWGRTLTPKSIALQASGPDVPTEKVEFVKQLAFKGAGAQAERFFLFFKLANWPRGAKPRYFIIRCPNEQAMEVERFIEADKSIRVVSRTGPRPPYVAEQFALLEFSRVEDCNPKEVSSFSTNYAIETVTTALPGETLKALDSLQTLRR